MIIFKGGNEVNRIIGAYPEPQLRSKIDSILSGIWANWILLVRQEAKTMNQLNPLLDFEELMPDFEFEAMILERNNREAEMLIKKGYKIKKSVWNGFIAS